MTIQTKSASETQEYGRKLAEKIKNGGVVALYGELGAGKTTLIQGIAQGLGIKQRITSPTFIIVRQYDRFWHVDLYRLTSLDEAKAVGIEEIINDPVNIVVIEWPELIKDILPKHYIEIRIKSLSNEEREIDEVVY